jgi:hypothetical protein
VKHPFQRGKKPQCADCIVERTRGKAVWTCSCPTWAADHRECRHIKKIKRRLGVLNALNATARHNLATTIVVLHVSRLPVQMLDELSKVRGAVESSAARRLLQLLLRESSRPIVKIGVPDHTYGRARRTSGERA